MKESIICIVHTIVILALMPVFLLESIVEETK